MKLTPCPLCGGIPSISHIEGDYSGHVRVICTTSDDHEVAGQFFRYDFQDNSQNHSSAEDMAILAWEDMVNKYMQKGDKK